MRRTLHLSILSFPVTTLSGAKDTEMYMNTEL